MTTLLIQKENASIPEFNQPPKSWLNAYTFHRITIRTGLLIIGWIVPFILFWLWQTASTSGWVNPQILPAPSQVYRTLDDLWGNGDLWSNLKVSLWRVFYGFLAGGIIGLLLGVLMGVSRQAEAYLLPSFKAISLIPVIGWIPFFILLVGIDDALKILIIAKAAMVPLTINTFKGIRNIPAEYFELARVYRLTRWQTVRRVLLPATVPSIFGGLRLSLTNAWISLVAVELLASSEGVGYLMVYGRQLFQLDLVIAMMVVIGLVGFFIDWILRRLENWLLKWRPTF